MSIITQGYGTTNLIVTLGYGLLAELGEEGRIEFLARWPEAAFAYELPEAAFACKAPKITTSIGD